MSRVKEVHQAAFHRNGISGEPFWAILFKDDEDREMVGIVFDEPHHCAILELKGLNDPKVGVTFGKNSWRGDSYEPALRQLIKLEEEKP